MTRDVVINTDGGARGNPGPAAIGAVVYDLDGHVLAEISEPLGVATNNVAEYTAVLRALEKAAELGAKVVQLRSDSLLLIEQLNGNFKVKNPTLQVLHQKVREAAKAFETVSFTHVRRERNVAADALVNEALDSWITENGYPAVADPPTQGSLLEPD